MLFPVPPRPGLVGIARLAAGSQLLEAKSGVRYFELPSRGILNRTRPGMPFEWSINPYRGCEFACKYCYARYTHEFMGMDDPAAFEDRIYAKAAAPGILRCELRRVPGPSGIAIGTATDPYQPAETRFGRTRAILEVFAEEKGRRLSITTKSPLVTRDIPLLREVARRNVLHVNVTLTTLDRALARLLEPRAPRPDLRLAAIARLAEAGISTGVFPNPVMPWITDTDANLDAVAAAVRAAGAGWFGGGPLFLMPSARKVFLPFLEEHFPRLAEPYRRLYAKNARLGGRYKEDLRRRVRVIRERHGLASEPAGYCPELADEAVQLSLFE